MEIPQTVPVMTLRSATLFPQALLPLHIFEPRYRRMLTDALAHQRMLSVALQRADRRREAPSAVAGLGLIRVCVDLKDGTSHLILQGLVRVELGEALQHKPYRVHAIRPLKVPAADNVKIDALVAKVHELVEQRVTLGELPALFPLADGGAASGADDGPLGTFSISEMLAHLRGMSDGGRLADLVSCALLPEPAQRQCILEAVEVEPRLQRLIHFLMAEIKRHPDNSNR